MTQDAKAVGIKGFVVKDHNVTTAPHAAIINEVQSDVKVVGGITIARSNGGYNPFAVETSFKLGGKVAWMPSLESAWMFEMLKSPGFGGARNYKSLGGGGDFQGLSALVEGSNTELTQSTKEIIALCKQYNGVFETSHFSKKETNAAIEEAKRQNLSKFVITHANTEVTRYSVAEQKELIEKGAVMMYVMAPYLSKPGEAGEDLDNLGALIKEVGAKHIVLATDFGLNIWPPAVEGVRMLIACLLAYGIDEDDIRVMLKENPERLYMD